MLQEVTEAQILGKEGRQGQSTKGQCKICQCFKLRKAGSETMTVKQQGEEIRQYRNKDKNKGMYKAARSKTPCFRKTGII